MTKRSLHRVVITGLGAVSSIGNDCEQFLEHLKKGTSGIRPIGRFQTERFGRSVGGEVQGFDVTREFPGESQIAGYGRTKQMMLVATRECLRDAKFDPALSPYDIGVAIGTTMGESQTFERITDMANDGGTDAIMDEDLLDYLPNSISRAVADQFGIRGPNWLISNACAAGSFSIGQAYLAIQSGDCSAMLVGGADSFSRYAYAGFCRVGAVSPDVPRPFSKNRRGMVPGEGAAALLLESYDSAQARGAMPYAEIIGYGESCDAYHMTQPNENGIASAMQRALSSSGVSPDQIDCVSVHGTGTAANDVAESKAIRQLFGTRQVPVSAVKSMLGHAMGAASALESVAMLLAIRHQFLFPTTNFEEPDPACEVDCIANTGRSAKIQYVLKTASAFGGNNAALVFKALNHA